MFGLLVLFAAAAFVAIKGSEVTKENADAKANGKIPTDIPNANPPISDDTLGPNPPGWPKSGPDFETCDSIFRQVAEKRGKDATRTLIGSLVAMSDAQWAEGKKTICDPKDPLAVGFCACIDSTRQYTKYMIENGIMEAPPSGTSSTTVTKAAVGKVANTFFPTKF